MTTITIKMLKDGDIRTEIIDVKPPMKAEQMEQIKMLKAKGHGCIEAGAAVSKIESGKITIEVLRCKSCYDALLNIILPMFGKVKSVTYRLE